MIETSSFIEEIQNAVYAPDAADPDLLSDSAGLYSEACAEANARLRQIEPLLKRGLRSEAIQLAEREPNLLDLVAMLDFPEASQWCQLLGRWGRVQPPRLLLDIASQLNEAYAEELPLKDLLRSHRLLALAHAELSPRIQVLRNILRLDPENPAWQSDLQALETEREKQIRNELEAARKQGDLECLRALTSELSSGKWSRAPSEELIVTAQSFYEDANAQAAMQELRVLSDALTNAYAEFDVDSGREIRERWLQLMEIANLDDADPIAERTNPALDWLDELDVREDRQLRFQSSIESLEEALDNEASYEELERLYNHVARFEEPLPASLSVRYNERIAILSLSVKRRYRLIVLAAVGILCVVGATVYSVLSGQRMRHNVATAVKGLSSLVEEKKFDQANEFFDELAPWLQKTPQVQEQKLRLDRSILDESERQSSFEEAISRAETAGVESPDHDALRQADELAIFPGERLRVSKLKSAIDGARSSRKRALEAEFLMRVEALRKRVAQVEKTNLNSRNDLDEFAQLLKEMRKAINEVPFEGSPMVAQMQAMITRVETLRDGVEMKRKQNQTKERITNSVGNLAAFREALSHFAKQFPNASASLHYKQAIEGLSLIEKLQQWAKFLGGNEFKNLATLDSSNASTLLKRGDKLLKTIGGSPLSNEFERRRKFLEGVEARGDGRLAASLGDLLRDAMIENVWMIRTANGVCYYTKQNLDKKKPDESGGKVILTHYLDFTLAEKRTGIKKEDIEYAGRAAQSILATKLKPKLDRLNDMTWESNFYEMLQDVREATEIDPILRMILLRKFLLVTMKGSEPLEVAFAPVQKRLTDETVDLSVNWISPNDADASVQRARARQLLKKLPDFASVAMLAAQKLKAHRLRPVVDYEWVGWVDEDRGQQGSKCRFPDAQNVIGDLYILVSATASGKPEGMLQKIGRIEKGQVTLQDSPPSIMIPGTPVFILKSP